MINLPNGPLHNIFSFLDVKSLCHMQSTAKKFRLLINEGNEYWKKIFYERFKYLPESETPLRHRTLFLNRTKIIQSIKSKNRIKHTLSYKSRKTHHLPVYKIYDQKTLFILTTENVLKISLEKNIKTAIPFPIIKKPGFFSFDIKDTLKASPSDIRYLITTPENILVYNATLNFFEYGEFITEDRYIFLISGGKLIILDDKYYKVLDLSKQSSIKEIKLNTGISKIFCADTKHSLLCFSTSDLEIYIYNYLTDEMIFRTQINREVHVKILNENYFLAEGKNRIFLGDISAQSTTLIYSHTDGTGLQNADFDGRYLLLKFENGTTTELYDCKLKQDIMLPRIPTDKIEYIKVYKNKFFMFDAGQIRVNNISTTQHFRHGVESFPIMCPEELLKNAYSFSSLQVDEFHILGCIFKRVDKVYCYFIDLVEKKFLEIECVGIEHPFSKIHFINGKLIEEKKIKKGFFTKKVSGQNIYEFDISIKDYLV